MKFKRKLNFAIVILLTLAHIAVSCKDSSTGDEGYDSSKPTTFSGFSPKEGSARTRMYIDGENFGTDISKISVTIGGVKTTVIGSDGNRIYCMVPPRIHSGEVEIVIYGNNGKPAIEYQFEDSFDYIVTSAVSTLTGKTDPSKPLEENSSIVNGTFEEAEFEYPWWLAFDKTAEGEKHLYVCERGRAIRRVNLSNETVSTVFTNGQGMFRNMQTMAFDVARDTMFFVDDNGQNNKNLTVISYSVKSENFRNVYPYIYDRTGYSCAVNPLNGDLYYNTYWDQAVMKARGQYNTTTKEWEGKEMFKVNANNNSHTYIFMHPEGLYAYILGSHAVMKSDIVKNSETGVDELTPPRIHAGSQGKDGYNDAPGTAARFHTIGQGVFVKNKQYETEGREDIYDFYLVEEKNYCVRIVTPDSHVSTFAGRGSMNMDNNKWGYVDGDLREEARFRDPFGIAYDEETETFYVADRGNKRIRTISVE